MNNTTDFVDFLIRGTGIAPSITENMKKGISELHKFLEPIIIKRRKADPYYSDEIEESHILGASLTAIEIITLGRLTFDDKEKAKENYIENWHKDSDLFNNNEAERRKGAESNYNLITEKFSDLIELCVTVYKLFVAGYTVKEVEEYYKGLKL